MKNYKLINFCEIKDDAVELYCKIHNVDKELNLGDINNVDPTKNRQVRPTGGGFSLSEF